jgi:hypothetical protein
MDFVVTGAQSRAVYRPGAVLATVLTTLVFDRRGPRNGKKLRPGLDRIVLR